MYEQGGDRSGGGGASDSGGSGGGGGDAHLYLKIPAAADTALPSTIAVHTASGHSQGKWRRVALYGRVGQLV